MDYQAAEGFEQRVEPRSLAAHFAAITDQRKRRGKRSELAPLLVWIALAKLCGAGKPVETAEWVSARTEALKQALSSGLETDAPGEHLSAPPLSGHQD